MEGSGYRARQDIVLPLAWPIIGVDGKTEITEIPIKKNTNVIVSIIGANRCKKIWGEDAEEWKPERWLEPLPESVAKAHMPGVYASMSVLALLQSVKTSDQWTQDDIHRRRSCVHVSAFIHRLAGLC